MSGPQSEKSRDPTLDEVMKLHEGGKLRMVLTCEMNTVADLRRIYTPGVALVCKAVESDPAKFRRYTTVGNTIAVVTNGTAVLGLGDIGVMGAMPVMEGKSAILIRMAGVSSIPILVDTKDADEFVRAVELIAPTFGAILLEDVAAPMCFEVEDRLKASLKIPVFHDDQHGTAVVVLGALIRALALTGRDKADCRVVINGAGAAGSAIARYLLAFGIHDVVLCDRKGALYRGRTDGMNPAKEDIARVTNRYNEKGTLAEVFRGKDVFIGVSGPGLVTQDMVRSMRKDPIIFALANPIPEIWPEEALAAGAAIADHGRNINNALGFPGLFRGTLDAEAACINEPMKLAASHALAGLAPKGKIVPDFMDLEVHRVVAAAVADAARKSGVSRAKV